ncbi:Hpt domain-containing protein, partial [Delftia acidovorans]|uniref:Hpt domain-containing protein n=1 Tax=Delftia acidovorans TaxID=80866 RepID=UPI0035A05DF8
PAPAWDPVQLRQRLASQSPRMLHAIEGFAQDFADAPQQLRSAARSGNWATVASLAHTFKGSLGYLGANLLEQWSAMAETGAHACLSGDGNGGNARPSGDLPSLVQALADGLQGLLAEIAVRSRQAALPPLATVSSAAPLQQRQRQPMTAEEVSSTLARLRRQIADSDYAAVAELERLWPLVSGRHASVLQRIQRCTESLETEAALQALDQLARSMAANRMAPQGAADA